MAEIRKMADEANRMGQQAQEQFQRTGQEFQNAAEGSFQAASRSFGELNRGFQAMADELNDFSKSRWEEVFHAWEQLLRARHFGDMVEVQLRYAQRAREAYMSEISKLGEICLGTARNASKPVEESSRRFR
jgi:hypothetical protein